MHSLTDIITGFDPSVPFHVPAGWFQGRTVYGGLSAALALQTVVHSKPDLPPIKTMQVTFVAPATGELTFASKELRSGKSLTSIGADCLAGNSVVLHTTMLFAQERESQIAHEQVPRPSVKAPLHYPEAVRDPRFVPACAFNFEMRPAGGSEVISGAKNPELLVWVKHLSADGVHPAVALVALADALPPAAFTAFTKPAPISSVSWTIDFVRLALPGGWFLLRSISRWAAHGYSLQDMEVWDEQGNLIILGRQTVAIFA
ncbi:thioesterase family protein [Pantoea sp. WMus005]|uniref:thioesterase family protein n=1 Tax=Pantoea sp. WMus005 TaxID=2750734 RepID=UPI0015D00608|nr:thioesterase family protein [Pantoea sp. WMus005]NYS30687.1 thioesterase family protein [Pantoea sp. WMus005]